jgi:hypothetical protein
MDKVYDCPPRQFMTCPAMKLASSDIDRSAQIEV